MSYNIVQKWIAHILKIDKISVEFDISLIHASQPFSNWYEILFILSHFFEYCHSEKIFLQEFDSLKLTIFKLELCLKFISGLYQFVFAFKVTFANWHLKNTGFFPMLV